MSFYVVDETAIWQNVVAPSNTWQVWFSKQRLLAEWSGSTISLMFNWIKRASFIFLNKKETIFRQKK
jgi:hypothetical protein